MDSSNVNEKITGFKKLTPTQEVDLSGYEDALDFVFSQEDTKNIAISGAYGSGKSSVIESYEKKHKEKHFIHLSLAHFQQDNGTEDLLSQKEFDNIGDESRIEGKILNQLIQQIPPEKIPQTNFRVKRDIDKKSAIRGSVLICVFLLLSLYCVRFESWKSFIEGFDEGLLKTCFCFTTIPVIRILCGAISIVILYYGLYIFIRVQHNKNILRKISVQGNEIEIFSDNNDSYFDKYLNEVLYLFENTGVDGIVFEDIDRFDNVTIFERLREINTLANIRLKKKNGSTLRFFYLLRDDIFYNKDRVKFFDYILPVVPVVDGSNSYDVIKRYLEEINVYDKFDDHFLRGISLYIDDLRILNNIFNEFLMYNKKLNKIELDSNQMFALVTYKNIFPKDFSELQLNRGFVYAVFNNKTMAIEEQLKALSEKKDELTNRIGRCVSEELKSLKELDFVKAGYKQEENHSYDQSLRIIARKWIQNEYPQRRQVLEDRNHEKQMQLEKELLEVEQEIEKIHNCPLAQLLNNSDIIDKVFRVSNKNEIGEVEDFNEVKTSPYFSLLKYLISRGYINESYSDYMTFFYPNSLSLGDKMFLRGVMERNEKQFSYHLDSPALIMESLNEYDLSQKETLNFDLSNHVLSEGEDGYISSMIGQLEQDKRFDYIVAYMESGKDYNPLVVAINKKWPAMFHHALSFKSLPEDLIKKFSYTTVEKCSKEILNNINIDNCLTNYVSMDPTYLRIDDIDVEKVVESFKVLGVSFSEIDVISVNKELFESVYKNNLYDINEANIKLMLENKCKVPDVQKTLSSLFTFIRSNHEELLCQYLWENANETLSVYFDFYNEGIQDTSDTIVDVINNTEISVDNKNEYVEGLITGVKDLSKISDNANQKLLLNNDRVEYSVTNILYYFSERGLAQELVKFINSSETELDYRETEKSAEFLKMILTSKDIEDVKYKQIVGNLCVPMEEFKPKELSSTKLEILIDLSLVPMNSNNLMFIRTNYSNDKYYYIKQNLEAYIQLTKESLFDDDEAIEIISWGEVTDQQKIEILHGIYQSIKVEGKGYSDTVVEYILEHNFDTNDIMWLAREYSNQSTRSRELIVIIAVNNFTFVLRNITGVDYALIKALLASEKLSFGQKIQLLKAIINQVDVDELCNMLLAMGADKIVDNLEGGHKRVDVTPENNAILDVLRINKIINNPEKMSDGLHFKRIKRK